MWRLDRWGRSVTDPLATLQELEHLGVGLTAGVDVDTAPHVTLAAAPLWPQTALVLLVNVLLVIVGAALWKTCTPLVLRANALAVTVPVVLPPLLNRIPVMLPATVRLARAGCADCVPISSAPISLIPYFETCQVLPPPNLVSGRSPYILRFTV